MEAYIYQADIHCADCNDKVVDCLEKRGIKKTEHDSDAWPQGPYSNGGGEADYPQHCCQCNVFMKNSLTSYGVDYVKHWVKQTPQSEVTKEWQDYYDYIDY